MEPAVNGERWTRLAEAMRKEISIADRKYLLKVYPKCFVALEAIDWLMQHEAVSREQAVALGQELVRHNLIVHVTRDHEFKDDALFFRFAVDDEAVRSSGATALVRRSTTLLPRAQTRLEMSPGPRQRGITEFPGANGSHNGSHNGNGKASSSGLSSGQANGENPVLLNDVELQKFAGTGFNASRHHAEEAWSRRVSARVADKEVLFAGDGFAKEFKQKEQDFGFMELGFGDHAKNSDGTYSWCNLHVSAVVMLCALFCFSIISVGLIIFGISYSAGTTGILLLETQARSIILGSINGQLEGLVTTAFYAVHTLSEELRLAALRGTVNLTDANYQSIRPYILPLARQFCATLYLGFPTGYFLGYSRVGLNSSYGLVQSDLGVLVQRDWTIDPIGEPVTNYGQRSYDARRRPWYQSAIASGVSQLTAVYNFTRTPALGITATIPVFQDLQPLPQPEIFFPLGAPLFVTPHTSTAPLPPSSNRSVSCVVACDITISIVSTFLRNITSSSRTSAFVLDNQGYFLGSSDESLTNFSIGALTHSSAIRTGLLNAVMNALVQMGRGGPINMSNYTDYVRLPTVQTLDVSFNGELFRISTSWLSLINWYSVVAIPNSEYLAAPQWGFYVSLIVGICIIFVAAILVVFLTLLITRPMKRIQQSMEVITSDLKFDQGNGGYSMLQEIDSIQRSFSRMKKGLESFSRYVPLSVVRILMSSNASAVLGVDPGEATLFFSDIEGFTTLSETVDPSILISTLEEYFHHMSQIIDEQQGTVGDYIGDAIFAFWNAPLPVPKHPALAMQAALQQQRCLEGLRERWKERGWPQLRVRMGMSLGRVLMGNVGSTYRLKYTLLGDSVNLASRLEGLNKYYGTYILVNGALHEAVKDEFVFRTVDCVAVAGKAEGTMVFELLCERGDASAKALFVENLSKAAFQAYLARQWDIATEFYNGLRRALENDKISELFLARITRFRLEPPPSWWKGVHVMDTK